MIQVVGLTGSIAMGKSYTARMFRRFGVPVFDSDAEVHALFASNGPLPKRIDTEFPGVLDEQGHVDRRRLAGHVLDNPAALARLEGLVHPHVKAAQYEFLGQASRRGFQRAVLDIPLLYETGSEQRFDVVLVVACSTSLQRSRALARPGMTAEKFDAILKKQMPAAEKIRRADRVIRSGYDRGYTVREIAAVLDWLDTQPASAWPRNWH